MRHVSSGRTRKVGGDAIDGLASHARTADEAAAAGVGTSVLVDGHVHFHSCFSWKGFLESAATNFAAGRRQLGTAAGGPGFLLLTESAGVHAFRRLLDRPSTAVSAGWEIDPTSDGSAVILHRASGETVVLVAGRQVVTAEKLEVLALACDRDVVDGRPIGDAMAEVADTGAIPVVPWGFGKWWFGRGRLLGELIESDLPYRFYLGDNGGRPRIAPEPSPFSLARRRGIHVLPGSDPLPFDHQLTRVGAYGFELSGSAPLREPAAWIRDEVLRLAGQPRVFGRRETLPRFVRSQIQMRRAKRPDGGPR